MLTHGALRLAEYIESEPLRKKAQQEAQRAKLEALEKKLGIAPGGSSSEPVAGKKHRLDDTEYIEQSREIVDSVKSAVSVGESHAIQMLQTLRTKRRHQLCSRRKRRRRRITALLRRHLRLPSLLPRRRSLNPRRPSQWSRLLLPPSPSRVLEPRCSSSLRCCVSYSFSLCMSTLNARL